LPEMLSDCDNGRMVPHVSDGVNSKPDATGSRIRTGSESSSGEMPTKSMPSVFSRLTDRSHYVKNTPRTDNFGSPATNDHKGGARLVAGAQKSLSGRQWPLSPAVSVSRRMQLASSASALPRK
jgi:hypothetical protein